MVMKKLWLIALILSVVAATACVPAYQNVSVEGLKLASPSSVKKIPLKVAVVIPDENAIYSGRIYRDSNYFANFPSGKVVRKAVLDIFPSIFKEVVIIKGEPYPENIGAVIIPAITNIEITGEQVALGFGVKYSVAVSLQWIIANEKGKTIWEKVVSSSKTSRSEVTPRPDRIGLIGEAFSGAFAEAFRESVQEIGLSKEVRSHVSVKTEAEVQQSAKRSSRTTSVADAPAQSAEIASGNAAYAETKTAHTLDAYEKFLTAYPSSGYRREALEAMTGLIQKRNGTNADYMKFVSAYEDGLEFVPEKYRLALIGPEGMRVHDIVVLRKRGVEDSLIAAKIDMGKGTYKDFSFDEMDALKKMGIPAVLIKAMLDSTARAKREDEELKKKKAMEDILSEIQRAQGRLEELKAEQTSAVVPVSADQSQGPSVSDTVKNCAAQIAALEGCKQLPSLAAMVCKAAAKSQFPCE